MNIKVYVEELLTRANSLRVIDVGEERLKIYNFLTNVKNYELDEEVTSEVSNDLWYNFEEDYVHHYPHRR